MTEPMWTKESGYSRRLPLASILLILTAAGCTSSGGYAVMSQQIDALKHEWYMCSAKAYGHARRTIGEPAVAAEYAMAACQTEGDALTAYAATLSSSPIEIYATMTTARGNLKRYLISIPLT